MAFEAVLLSAGVLLCLAVLASKATGKLGIPSLLAFIGIGVLMGSEGPGGIYFDDYHGAQRLGIVALLFILMAGGMETPLEAIRQSLREAVVLATVGVLVTALAVGAFVHWVAGFTLLEGLLLGSILAATDAAAVFAQLRGSGVSLPPKLQALLELESGTNDPMAIFLTISLIELIGKPKSPLLHLARDFVLDMVIGAAVGLVVGYLGRLLITRPRLQFEALFSVLSISFGLIAYGLADVLHGNGFLAVYVMAVVYGNSHARRVKGLRKFHDGLGWLMQIVMFITLGLLVFPSHLRDVGFLGLFVSLFLLFIARPLGVMASLSMFRVPLRTQALVGWAGIRGAVPIVLATYPLIAQVPKAGAIFNIVFFVVLTSSLIQGTTLPWVAAKLGFEPAQEPIREPSPG